MGISVSPSTVTLPRENPLGFKTVLDFLAYRFSSMGRDIWEKRISESLVTMGDGGLVTPWTFFVPGARVRYYREVAAEPLIPFRERILFQDDHLIVACKPHFLPVVPSGPHVSETLLNRLKVITSNPDLVPINRIDRMTAGVVLFSVNPSTRGAFQTLFMEQRVRKVYEAVTFWPGGIKELPDFIENRIVRGEPWFRNRIVPGLPNAFTRLKLVKTQGNMAFFRLFPNSGKKHQLRLHLSSLGCPIINDRSYPELLPQELDNWEAPLQLLSREVAFVDPISGKERVFTSSRTLDLEKYFLPQASQAQASQGQTIQAGLNQRSVIPIELQGQTSQGQPPLK